MRIKLKVAAIEDMGADSKKRQTIKLKLSAPSEGTIYDHIAFIHLPWAEAQGIALGDEYELFSIGQPESFEEMCSPEPHVESRLERGVSAAGEAVTRVCGE
jgi:hypothetical protein